jgi:hypothetical protein
MCVLACASRANRRYVGKEIEMQSHKGWTAFYALCAVLVAASVLVHDAPLRAAALDVIQLGFIPLVGAGFWMLFQRN